MCSAKISKRRSTRGRAAHTISISKRAGPAPLALLALVVVAYSRTSCCPPDFVPDKVYARRIIAAAYIASEKLPKLSSMYQRVAKSSSGADGGGGVGAGGATREAARSQPGDARRLRAPTCTRRRGSRSVGCLSTVSSRQARCSSTTTGGRGAAAAKRSHTRSS